MNFIETVQATVLIGQIMMIAGIVRGLNAIRTSKDFLRLRSEMIEMEGTIETQRKELFLDRRRVEAACHVIRRICLELQEVRGEKGIIDPFGEILDEQAKADQAASRGEWRSNGEKPT